MNISYIRTQSLAYIGEVATTHPEAWCMSFAYIGLAVGVTMYAGLGYWLGGFSGHALTGSWCGLGLYAYWLAQSAETISSNIDVRVDMLRQMRQQLDA